MYYQYLSTHSNQWDGKCHNLWIISTHFNTALDSCSIYDQFIAVHRRSSKVRACFSKNWSWAMKFWQCIWIEIEIGKNDEKLENFLKLGRYWVKLTHLQNEVCGISSTSGYISLSWNQLLNALGCQEKKLNLIREYFGQFRSTRNSIIIISHFTWIIYMYCYMGRHN